MPPYPTQLALDGPKTLVIDWSDGRRLRYDVNKLRDACPCATCREKRGQPQPVSLLPVLAPQELTPLAITAMRPVGNYAYTIAFSDGHDTGIYSFERLLEIGEPAASQDSRQGD